MKPGGRNLQDAAGLQWVTTCNPLPQLRVSVGLTIGPCRRRTSDHMVGWIQFDESNPVSGVAQKGRPPAAEVEPSPFSAREDRVDSRIGYALHQRMRIQKTLEHDCEQATVIVPRSVRGRAGVARTMLRVVRLSRNLVQPGQKSSHLRPRTFTAQNVESCPARDAAWLQHLGPTGVPPRRY